MAERTGLDGARAFCVCAARAHVCVCVRRIFPPPAFVDAVLSTHHSDSADRDAPAPTPTIIQPRQKKKQKQRRTGAPLPVFTSTQAGSWRSGVGGLSRATIIQHATAATAATAASPRAPPSSPSSSERDLDQSNRLNGETTFPKRTRRAQRLPNGTWGGSPHSHRNPVWAISWGPRSVRLNSNSQLGILFVGMPTNHTDPDRVGGQGGRTHATQCAYGEMPPAPRRRSPRAVGVKRHCVVGSSSV